jgi:hypothetical protein
VQIPRPERYAIHKLIVAQRRKGPGLAKIPKDLTQAEVLLNILAEDRPGAVVEAFETAVANGPRWRDAIARSLKQRTSILETLVKLGLKSPRLNRPPQG